MKSGSLMFVFAGAALASGCGSRTSEEELLLYGAGVGGRSGNTGAASGIGGEWGVGGLPTVGGNWAVGGGGDGIGGTIIASGGVPSTSGGASSLDSCCEMGSGPGCNDPNIAYCVCDQDDYCCTTQWDEICATYAVNVCGALCGEPGVGGSEGSGGDGSGGVISTGGSGGGSGGMVGAGGAGGISGGDCCYGHSGRGCEVPVVESCVCESDPYCCNIQWDEICANSSESCGAQCDGGVGGAPNSGGAPGAGGAASGGTGGSGGAVGISSCCEPHSSTGCDQRLVQDCVCNADPFCCNITWDGLCADAAESCGAMCETGVGGSPAAGGASSAGGASNAGGAFGAGGNPPFGGASGNSGNCCESHSSTGCEDSNVEACVCGDDPFCCNNHWDGLCAGAAEECGAMCPVDDQPTEAQCDAVFPDECANCACDECYSDLDSCLDDFGCLAIFNCVTSRSCSGLDCYQPETCQGVIDSFGGLYGNSANLLFNVIECADNQGCPCP